MIKIVSPSLCEVERGNGKARSYAKIKFEDGRLSITGVVGPMSNGNCRGSAGQCVDEIRKGEPANGWTEEMLKKFCDIWDRWHLNHMRAYCQHMREAGWLEHFEESVKIEKWSLTREAYQMKKAAEEAALEALRNGKPFYPTKDQTAYARMEFFIDIYNDEDITERIGTSYKDAYALKPKGTLGDGIIEYKQRCMISYKEHPLGFMGRPCPVCGYEYGTKWLKEEVPSEVIEFLFSLPESETIPAWI